MPKIGEFIFSDFFVYSKITLVLIYLFLLIAIFCEHLINVYYKTNSVLSNSLFNSNFDFERTTISLTLFIFKQIFFHKNHIFLTPIKVGKVFRLNNLFFETASADLKSESHQELNRLVKFTIISN